jgi:hypothetical protein
MKRKTTKNAALPTRLHRSISLIVPVPLGNPARLQRFISSSVQCSQYSCIPAQTTSLRKPEMQFLLVPMLRLRALLAILLASTWCSAAWHVDLEAVGLMPHHEHRAHAGHDSHHTAAGAHDDYEQFVARDVASDQVRVGAATVTWVALLAFATWLVAGARPSLVILRTLRRRRETDPPLVQAWQFVQRCAPEAAAPPALG